MVKLVRVQSALTDRLCHGLNMDQLWRVQWNDKTLLDTLLKANHLADEDIRNFTKMIVLPLSVIAIELSIVPPSGVSNTKPRFLSIMKAIITEPV